MDRTRRHFIVVSGVGVAAAVAAAATALPLFEDEGESLQPVLLALLADPAGAARLGEIWMAEEGIDPNPPGLARKIAKRLRSRGWEPGSSLEATREALAARIRKDFMTADVVELAGWQLARTDVELCALAAASLEQIQEKCPRG